jgi:hypothetical protein
MWEVKVNEGGFRYIEAFGGAHDCKRIRVYIKGVCKLPDELTFPLIGYKIIQSAKGTHIIIPDERFCIHHIEIRSGYRGNAQINIDEVMQNETHITWESFHSPQGNLGYTANLIISLNHDRILSWNRSVIIVMYTQCDILLSTDWTTVSFSDPELE